MTYGDWRHAYHTIEPYNGYIYVVAHDFEADRPEEILSLLPTGEKASVFWSRIGGFQRSIELWRCADGSFRNVDWRISLTAISDIAEHTLRVSIPCPAHRKMKRPATYKNGWWYKETRNGWERL